MDPHRGRQAAQDRGRVKVGPGGASTCDQTVIGMSVDEKWQLARKVSCVGDGVTRRQAVPCLSRKLLPGRCWTPQGERIVSTRVRLFREPSNRRRTDAAAIQPVTRTQQAVCRCRAGLQPCQSIVSTLNIVIIITNDRMIRRCFFLRGTKCKMPWIYFIDGTSNLDPETSSLQTARKRGR